MLVTRHIIVCDVRGSTRARSCTGTGWTFNFATADGLRDAARHAISTYREYRESFDGIAKRGMQQDLSWDNAATLYEEVLVAAKYVW